MTFARRCLPLLLAIPPALGAEPPAAAPPPAVAKASQGASAAPSPVPPESMQGISFEALTAEQRKQAVGILNEFGCDCGCGMKIAVCRRDDAKCGRSRALAEQVIAAVKEGKPRDAIVKAILSPPSKFTEFALDAGDSPSVGPKGAKVTLLLYLDYQCPFCARVVPTIDRLLADYPHDLRVVLKMHPLSIHQNAERAAEAALAAHAQGKFFEMHRKLLENASDLSRDKVLGIARQIGLDLDRFTKELDDHAHLARARKEVQEVEAIGATGTPASFVNGRYLSGAKPYEVFKSMIDEEIAWARAGNRPKFTIGKNVREAAAQAAQAGPDPTKVYALPAGDAPSRGPAKAPVTLLHYLDYQCPVCARIHPTIEQIAEAYPDSVRIVYKMHPLTSIHSQAGLAAEAALAARAQGKFLEMHRKLFESSGSLSRERILAIGKEIGLDVARLTHDLDARAHQAAIDAETQEVMSIGATGTPTSFVNGRYILGAQPFEAFKKVIDEELAKAKATGEGIAGR